MDADRNFLLGLVALEAGLIRPDQLAEAGTAWMGDRRRPLLDVLAERGWISEQGRATLEARLREVERSTVAAHSFAPSGDLQVPDSGGDDQATRSWDSRELLLPAGEGTKGPAGGGFGARYLDPILHATGGLGRVWRVHDAVLGREVALKDLKPSPAPDEAIAARFVEEAKISSQLEHPNIIPVHDLGRATGGPFYSMPFLGSTTFKTAVSLHHAKPEPGKPDPWPLRRLLEAFVSVCNAIAFAHDKGVIHRDIKGQNVILGRYGEVIMLDWGLAKRLGAPDDPLAQPIPGAEAAPHLSMSRGTGTGKAIGTPNYMAPEQAAGDHDRIGKRTDVFGLGAMMYHLLTGRPPFEGGDVTEVLRLARESNPRKPRSILPQVPAALESICLKAMRRDPSQRYDAAADLAEDVRHYLADEPVSAHRETVIARVGRWTRRNTTAVIGAAAVLLTSTVVGAIGAWLVNEQKQRVAVEKYAAESAGRATASDLANSIELVDRLLFVMSRRLPPGKDSDRVKAEVADAALIPVGRFVSRHPADDEVRYVVGEVFHTAARAHLAYEAEKVDPLYVRAIDMFLAHAGADPHRLPVKNRVRVAACQMDYARHLVATGKSEEAGRQCRAALDILATLPPDDREGISPRRIEADANSYLGNLAEGAGRVDQAVAFMDKAVDRSLSLCDLADASVEDRVYAISHLRDRGILLEHVSGRSDDSRKDLEAALEKAIRLDQRAKTVDTSALVAMTQAELALLLGRQFRDHAGSARQSEGAIARLGSLVESHSEFAPFARYLAKAHGVKGFALADLDRPADAEREFAQARDLYRQIFRRFPASEVNELHPEHAELLGEMARRAKSADEASVLLDEALKEMEMTIPSHPENARVVRIKRALAGRKVPPEARPAEDRP